MADSYGESVTHAEPDRALSAKAKRKRQHSDCKRRNLEMMRANPGDPRHGTWTGYSYGCRCDRCRAAAKRKNALRYMSDPGKPHNPSDDRWRLGKPLSKHDRRAMAGMKHMGVNPDRIRDTFGLP